MDYAQSVGIGTTTPHANAILEIKSPNKGLLIPRMDSVVRKQIANTRGLLVYDTSTSSLWHNDGAKWMNYMNIAKGDITQDMLYWNGSNWVIMPKGLPGQLLVASNSGLPEWQYPATLAINDVTVTEGNAGTVNMTFTVTKTAIYDRAISVRYATANGTATAGADYTAQSGTLNFLPAEMSKTITVVVSTDVFGEPVETLSVNLHTAVSATITDATGTGTITDDDLYPAINIVSASQMTEGNFSYESMYFQVTLDVASNQPVTVNYQLNDGTATLGSDYYPEDNSVTFQPGETVKQIIVTIISDRIYELNESFTVELTSASGGHIVNGLATGQIYNDDPQPYITISDNAGPEGGQYNSRSITFTVQISATSSLPISVDYDVSSGTAILGYDIYPYPTAGTITFPAGYPSNYPMSITVYLIGDDFPEPNETFFVNLTNPVNVYIARSPATGTIMNDD